MQHLVLFKNFCWIVTITRLKQQLASGPSSGPYRACVEFRDVHEMMQQHYTAIAQSETTAALREAFPDAKHERSAKGGRKTYYIGVRKRAPDATVATPLTSGIPCSASPSSSSYSLLFSQLQAEKEKNRALSAEVSKLRSQVGCLEATMQESTVSLPTLHQEVNKLVSAGHLIIDQFDAFQLMPSWKRLVSWLQTC